MTSFFHSLKSHVIDVEVTGPGTEGNSFFVHTVRNNPASVGVVTGKQTYGSFLSSVLGELRFDMMVPFNLCKLQRAGAKDRGNGVHFC